MSVIQTGAGMWIDGFASESGAQIGRGYRTGTTGYSTIGAVVQNWGTTDSDSFTSVVSDVEEEGEVEETHEHSDADKSHADQLAEAIEAGEIDFGASPEVVAAIAADIGMIEAAMRKHQSTGVASFSDDDEETAEENQQGSNQRLPGKMIRNPALVFAATRPRQSRSGVLSLLA